MTSWIALIRLGWRNARRSPRRSLFVMALIALPVTAVVGGATGARMAVPSEADELRGRFGRADVVLAPDGGAEAAFAADLAAVLPDDARAVVAHGVGVRTADDYESMFLTDAPITDPVLEGRYELLKGRAPTRPGEIAPDRWAVDQYDLDVGDTLLFEGPAQRFTVVGVAVERESTRNQAAVVAPGSLAGDPLWYVDLGRTSVDDLRRALAERGYRAPDAPPGGRTVSFEVRGPPEVFVNGESDDNSAGPTKRDAASAGVFAAGVLAVGLAGLVASASFAVSLRRRQRELGLLGTVGADTRLLRRSVLLEGAVVGLLGSITGVGLGLLFARLARAPLEEAAGRLFGPLELHPVVLSGGLVLGTAGAAFAAWLPARAAARQSVVEALRARRPATPRRGRLAVAGVALAGLGLLGVAAGAAATSQGLLIGGGVAAFAGVLLAAPVAIERLSALAAPLPPTARIGVRDLARHRARSAALFAAVLAALTLPVAALAAVRSERAHAAEQYVPTMDETNLLLSTGLSGGPEVPAPSGGLQAPATQLADGLEGVVASGAIRQTVGASGSEADVLHAAGGSWSRRQKYPDPAQEGQPFSAEVVVADRSLLGALGIAHLAPELEAGSVLGVGPGTVDEGVVELLAGSRSLGEVPALEAAGPTGRELPGYLIAEHRARELGYQAGAPQGWLFRLDHRPTEDERDTARLIARRSDLLVSTEAGRFQPPVVSESVILAVAGAVALGVVVIVAALAAAEGRRERILLTAIGASPRAGRAAGAVGIAVLVLLAGLTASALGVGLVGAHQLGRGPTSEGGPGYSAVIPWSAVAFVSAAVPAAALAVAWLCNGRLDVRGLRTAR
ncbi:MAG: ABC transporter permease [Acidimicrobiales bacterium]